MTPETIKQVRESIAAAMDTLEEADEDVTELYALLGQAKRELREMVERGG